MTKQQHQVAVDYARNAGYNEGYFKGVKDNKVSENLIRTAELRELKTNLILELQQVVGALHQTLAKL